MAISRILTECSDVQAALGDLFIAVGQREQLPFLEYVLSPENSRLIRTEVAPGSGKIRKVQARWVQRLPETEVDLGGDLLSCTSTNVYGDTTKTYTLDTTDSYVISAVVNAKDIAVMCMANNAYVLETIMRLMDTMERAVASQAAIQTVAQIGAWGADAESFFTVTGDCLEIQTRQTTDTQELNQFALADIQQAATMANYPGSLIGFGGAEMQRYVNAVKAGSASQYGIDLLAISQQNGFAFAYDKRIAAAMESQNMNIVTTPGAVQWLSFNLADWNTGMSPVSGSNYTKQLVYTAAGLPCDLTMKDDCGNLSITLASCGIIATLPTDIYESADALSGVNYLNCVSIVNPV